MIPQFQHHLLTWFQSQGRHDLPWQRKTPYHTWLSEIMLQQTQVKTVIPYFQSFIEHFPDVFHLAKAPIDKVLKLWSGLGYYQRAHNLHRCAKTIVANYNGEFPDNYAILQTLPGIGPSTAAAIASLAFNQAHAIFDGNVKRVLSRVFRIHGPINDKAVVKQLQDLAQACMPNHSCHSYTQAIMDLGATCCKPKNPLCLSCPMQDICLAYQHQEVELLPAKAKKNKPKTKDYAFIAYFNEKAEILFVERENRGIWPKLWCLPEYQTNTGDQAELAFKHQLTHQTMRIQIYFKIWQPHMDAAGVWVSQEKLQNYGLPQAIGNQVSAIFAYVKYALQQSHQLDHVLRHD